MSEADRRRFREVGGWHQFGIEPSRGPLFERTDAPIAHESCYLDPLALLEAIRAEVPEDVEIGRPSADAGRLTAIHRLLWGH